MSCLCRWAQFRQCIDDIDGHLKSLRVGDPVNHKHSIGGAFYVSITSGFCCIDVRKFFLPHGETDAKPTRQGIALCLRECDNMKKIIDTINDNYPTLGTALPCCLSDDHQNQLGALQCRKCYPFTADLY